MSNPFSKNGAPDAKVPRSRFDLSFQNNLTFKLGQLIPCCCIPVVPGDEIDISTTFGLRFMPTVFPIQTRMKARIEYFYVRNRNLWKDFPDFLGKTLSSNKNGFPYFSANQSSRNPDFFKTGGLGDYLGLPTTIVGSYSQLKVTAPRYRVLYKDNVPFGVGDYFGKFPSIPVDVTTNTRYPDFNALKERAFSQNHVTPVVGWFVYPVQFPVNSSVRIPLKLPTENYEHVFVGVIGTGYYEDTITSVIADFISSLNFTNTDIVTLCDFSNGNKIQIVKESDGTLSWLLTSGPHEAFNYCLALGTTEGYIDILEKNKFKTSDAYDIQIPPRDVVSDSKLKQPWDPNNGAKVSTLRARAYESIYNAFYRDERNNPLIVDGEKCYNKYIDNDEGGPDSFNYQMHYRNWEQDQFTTAVASPQQGLAPLVGITATGMATFLDTDTGKEYVAKATFEDDNETISGFQMLENVPNSVARSLVDVATSGISINDLRNVNSFQRWLEANIRRGYKYRDIIKSHFDVDVSFAELDMPEFLGGCSCEITPSTVTQTSSGDSASDPLGSYAGQLYGTGSSRNNVHKFFDEHGYFIGIISVVPVPNYSQIMEKDWFKGADPFDYYWPEFANIGMQPVMSRELAPNQLINDGSSDFNTDTFGYQRPWYEYMAKVDEVHGLFRTQLANFVMNRTFDLKPVLGPDFLLVDPEQLNDVFSVQDVEDKVLGQLYFEIDMKRPIPAQSVPRLE